MLTDDQTLWNLLCQGNVNAFKTLFNLYWEPLFQTSYKVIKSREDSEEIVSDLFINLWNTRSNLKEVKQVSAYLHKAVKNRTLNQVLKQKAPVVVLDSEINNLSSSFVASELLDNKEQENIALSYISVLPEKMRKIYFLYTFENLTVKEIAIHTNNSPQTIRNQLNTAYKKIRELFLKGTFILIFIFLNKNM